MHDNEPDILAGYASSDVNEDQENAKIDINELSEDDFQTRYKGTKRQYKALVDGLVALHEVRMALQEPGPMDIDSDITDSTQFLIEDFEKLLEQMHSASYWEREGR